MIDFDLLQNIKELVSKIPEDYTKKTRVITTKQFLFDLLSGRNVDIYRKKLISTIDGINAKSEHQMSDYELLLTVLQRCDEDTLIELERDFGKNSRITKIIRENIRGFSPNENTSNIEIKIKDMISEAERMGDPFYSLVCKRMQEKGFETDADFYNSISMSRQNFARIRNLKKKVGKPTVLWIVVGLKLNYHESREMLETAGFAFKKNDKTDIVISQIIKNVPNYDLDMVNETLYHFGLRPLFEE